MLQPKRTKYRKQMKGRTAGLAMRGSDISFGDFALQALEPGWITSRQIEAARIAMTRKIKRGGNEVGRNDLNLNRKYRRIRWLRAAPLTPKACSDTSGYTPSSRTNF